MGDPKKQHKTYEKPLIPWDERRIEDEKELKDTYGLRKKKEILKSQSILRNLQRRARDVAASGGEAERTDLLERSRNLGLVGDDAGTEDVLRIGVRDVLDRRLQSLVSNLDRVKTVDQARQFIVHGHVRVGDRKVTTPSFLVPEELEDKIKVKEGLDGE